MPGSYALQRDGRPAAERDKTEVATPSMLDHLYEKSVRMQKSATPEGASSGTKYLDVLMAYVPSLVARHLLATLETHRVPSRESFETVVLFCDVSGFTKLSEAMALSGRGAEGLKTHLNSPLPARRRGGAPAATRGAGTSGR